MVISGTGSGLILNIRMRKNPSSSTTLLETQALRVVNRYLDRQKGEGAGRLRKV
jgi:hypothetical protein